ncbi:MAG TPA: DUF5658 family protein [Blastocatellia bacterium]|nr:DUF5658 family protein [Blastocatellia bacterium]
MYRTGELFQDRKLFMYVIIAIVMSGYDAVATMQHISRGVAAEGNPLMDSLIQQHALLFFLVKMTITAFGLMVCYSFSKLRTARFGIRLVVILYSLVCMYHVMIILFE